MQWGIPGLDILSWSIEFKKLVLKHWKSMYPPTATMEKENVVLFKYREDNSYREE